METSIMDWLSQQNVFIMFPLFFTKIFWDVKISNYKKFEIL